jgi:hypothetical protein
MHLKSFWGGVFIALAVVAVATRVNVPVVTMAANTVANKA